MGVLDDWLKRANNLVDEYALRDVLLDELDGFYFLEGERDEKRKDAADEVDKVRLPHASNVVDLVQDLLAGAKLSITVPSPSEGERDKQLADTAEGYLRSVMADSERAQRTTVMSKAGWLVAMRGCLAGRVLFWPKLTEKVKGADGERFEQKAGVVPIRVQVRDPRYVYPRFSLDGLDYVAERRTRTVEDLRSSYGDDLLPKRNEADEVVWTEYWDEERFAYFVDAEPLVREGAAPPWPHHYGGMPYAYEFARQTGRTEAEKRARPLLASLRDVIRRMDLTDTQEATFVGKYIGDTLNVFSDRMAEPGSDRPVTAKTGGTNWLFQDEKVEWLNAGRTPIELQASRAKYEAAFEKGTFPTAMYGTDPGRMMAGYALNLLNQSGQVRMASIISCLERWTASMLSNVLMLTESHVAPMFGGSVKYWTTGEAQDDAGGKWRTRKENSFAASKLHGYHVVEVKLGELMPADKQANMVLAGRARTPDANGRPLLSWETTVTMFGLTDEASEERDRIDQEMAWNDPGVAALRKEILVARQREKLAEELRGLGQDPDAVLARALGIPSAPAPSAEPALPPGAGPMPGMPPEMMPPELAGQMMPQPMGGPLPGEGMTPEEMMMPPGPGVPMPGVM